MSTFDDRRSPTDPSRLTELAVVLESMGESESAQRLMGRSLEAMMQISWPELRGDMLQWAMDSVAGRFPNDVARELLNGALRKTNRGQADVRAYLLTAVVGLEATAGDSETAEATAVAALEAAAEIPWEELRTQHFVSTVELIVRVFERDVARNLLEQAWDIAGRIDSGPGFQPDRLRESMATAMARIGSLERAMSIFASIGSAGSRFQAQVEIAVARARLGDLEQALLLADELEAYFDWREIALAGIAVAQVEGGDREGASATLALARETIGAGALIPLVQAVTRAGEVAEAFSKASSVDDPGRRAAAMITIAEALSQNRSIERAEDVLALFSTAAQALSETPSFLRAEVFGSMALAFAESGNASEADAVLTHAVIDAGRGDDPEARAEALVYLVFEFALSMPEETSAAEDALRRALVAVAGEIGAGDLDSEILLPNLATALALVGEPDRALGVVNAIGDRDTRDGPLRSIASAQTAAGDVRQALSTAARISEDSERAIAWAEIAANLAP